MSTQRMERVNALVKREISYIVQNLKDPRLGMVTVTSAEVSADLKCAKIFFSILGAEDEKNKTLKILTSASPHMRSQLGKKIKLRHIPALNFIWDDSIERGTRILRLINQVSSKEENNENI